MNILDPQQWDKFLYCSACADICGEGIAWGANLMKICNADCPSSAPFRAKLAYSRHYQLSRQGLYSAPFEICAYCQAKIIISGTKWSTYYCDVCRPLVLQINDLLDKLGFVVPPIGGNSLQNLWQRSKPFLAIPHLFAWKEWNLRRYWDEYTAQVSIPSPSWSNFSTFIEETRYRSRFRDFDVLVASLQGLGRDELQERVNLINFGRI